MVNVKELLWLVLSPRKLTYYHHLLLLVAIVAAIHLLLSDGRSFLDRRTATSAAIENSNITITSKLFPPALDMMKRGIPLENEYTCFDENISFTNKTLPGNNNTTTTTLCSCNAPLSTPKNSSALCCERRVFTTHKMGHFIAVGLAQKLRNNGIAIPGNKDWIFASEDYRLIHDHFLQPTIDFRDAMIMRNIYDSLISGYLYHKEGKECWLDFFGKPWKKPSFYTEHWTKYIDLTSQTSKPYDTLCHCLANETEADGMKIYVEWVFHLYYHKTFEFWALSRGWPSCQPIQKRVEFFCFEDLASKTSLAASSVEKMIDFLIDSSTSNENPAVVSAAEQPMKKENSTQAYDGGHSTSRDPTLRRRLLEIVKQIDHEDYNDDIAWLHSVLPCQ